MLVRHTKNKYARASHCAALEHYEAEAQSPKYVEGDVVAHMHARDGIVLRSFTS